jgi:hypothetical protein
LYLFNSSMSPKPTVSTGKRRKALPPLPLMDEFADGHMVYDEEYLITSNEVWLGYRDFIALVGLNLTVEQRREADSATQRRFVKQLCKVE